MIIQKVFAKIITRETDSAKICRAFSVLGKSVFESIKRTKKIYKELAIFFDTDKLYTFVSDLIAKKYIMKISGYTLLQFLAYIYTFNKDSNFVKKYLIPYYMEIIELIGTKESVTKHATSIMSMTDLLPQLEWSRVTKIVQS